MVRGAPRTLPCLAGPPGGWEDALFTHPSGTALSWQDLTVGQFVYVIRKRIAIPSDKAIFIFVANTLPPAAALMSTVYEQHRDEDGFMYMMYSGEVGTEAHLKHLLTPSPAPPVHAWHLTYFCAPLLSIPLQNTFGGKAMSLASLLSGLQLTDAEVAEARQMAWGHASSSTDCLVSINECGGHAVYAWGTRACACSIGPGP